MLKKLFAYWNTETDGISLHLFRIVFGVILALELYKFYFLVIGYANVPYHVTYDFFHFVRPVSGTLAKVLYGVFCVSAILAALGIWFRVTLFVALSGFTYSFLIDKCFYNNHHYLYILIGLLLLFSYAGKGINVRHPFETARIPVRQLWAVRFMVCLVYFYGGINKLNYDWLIHAEPLRSMLLPDLLGKEAVGSFQHSALAFLLSYGGILIDLLSGIFLLFENKLKRYLLWGLLVFHSCNHLFFDDINTFPFFSIVALLLFIHPETAKQKTQLFFSKTVSFEPSVVAWKNWLLISFVILELLIPLRHQLIPGNFMWHERGFLFSWTMKLRHKDYVLAMSYKVAGSPNIYPIQISKYVTQPQAQIIAFSPVDLVQFAHFIEAQLQPHYNGRDIQVYAENFVALNSYRPLQLIVNPYTDLTTIDVRNKISIKNYDWIVPLGKDQFGLQVPPIK